MRRRNSFGGSNRSRKPSNRKVRWNGGSKSNKRKQLKQLNPDHLISKAAPLPEKENNQQRMFAELPISDQLKERIASKGYVHLTEIQDSTFEVLREGRDVMGIAKTGTGKTGAFLIPLIDKLITSGEFFQTLILVPTRELALQVEQEMMSLTKGLSIYSTSLIGGTSVRQDINRLKRKSQFVIGTPGRVIDMMDRNALKLNNFSTFILDEFDRMLDMGFVNDVVQITDEMVNRKQTMLFSATENKSQKPFINKFLNQPAEVRLSTGNAPTEHIEQDVVRIASGENKFDILLQMLNQEEFKKVLVFAETKRKVAQVTNRLKKSGVRADEIHGDKAQGYRKKALHKFRSGNIKVLVATDVAARGIDVDDITHVINYELPQNMESYVHRIGRTGRAGKAGTALTLVG